MQSDALSTALTETGAGLWALVDPALCPESLTHYSTQGERHSLPLPGLAVRGGAAESVVPFLSRLATDSEHRHHDLAVQSEWALRTHGVSWLESDLSGSELARVLGRRMDAVLPDGQAALIRFADARVLPVLHAVLNDEQRPSFFAPVSRWWYFDRRERLTTVELAGPAPSFSAWETPWKVEREQEIAMLSAAEADTVLALLNELSEDDVHQIPRSERHAFVSGQIERAQCWRIEAPKMQAAFCLAALCHGEAFSDQPSWQVALDKVRAGGWSLLDAIDAMGSQAAA